MNILTKLILIISLLLLAPLNSEAVTIDLDTIVRIESTYNTGEYNEDSGAIGLYQITAICLEDYNDKSEKIMKSHGQIKVIFDNIEKRIENINKKVNVKKQGV